MHKLVFALLLLLVLLAPLPLGSNREWSWTLGAVLASVIALAWTGMALLRPASISHRLNPVLIIMFLAVALWAWLQTVPWTPPAWHHPLWAMAGEALGRAVPGSITISAEDTFTALLRLLSYALVFVLSFQLARSRERALSAYRWLTLAGFAYAVYGLIAYWGEFGSLFWFRDQAFNQDVRSTFVNRNSYATYAGLTLLSAMAWFYQSAVMRRSNRVYDMPQDRQMRIERFILNTWKPLTALLLMSTALILTHSRGGFISTVAGSVVLLVALNHRQAIDSVRSRAVIGAAIAVAVLAFVLSSEVLLERMDRIDLDGASRMAVYEQVARPLQQGHWRGMGYGTFSDSFRMFRGDDLIGQYDKAHNTYLENIFELGWPAALLLFATIGWLGWICLRGVLRRGRDWVYPATGLAATVLVGVHSAFDFSLQMPAVAITYAFIMGVACAQSYSSRGI